MFREFEKIAESSGFDFHLVVINSEADLIRFQGNNSIFKNSKIVLTSFIYNNFNFELFETPQIYLLGPLFDIDRGSFSIIGNWGEVFKKAGGDFFQDSGSLSFYTDADVNLFPEKEIVSFISKGAEA